MSLDVTLRTSDICPHCGKNTSLPTVELYSANITHNLSGMAEAAGIYRACWRPEEVEITKAKQLIPFLEMGLKVLREDPETYKGYNSPNGWGKYECFVPWVEKYLQACVEFPEADVSVSR